MRPFHDLFSFIATQGRYVGLTLRFAFFFLVTTPAGLPSLSLTGQGGRARGAALAFLVVSNSWFFLSLAPSAFLPPPSGSRPRRSLPALSLSSFPWVVRGRVELPTSTLSV